MTQRPALLEDWINAIFRPVIGFFSGVFLGYMAQLAAISGWMFALGVAGFCALLVAGLVIVDRATDHGIDAIAQKLGWIGYVKHSKSEAKPSKTKHRPHWFVRYGFIIGVLAGAGAVFYLPQEVF